MAGCQTISSSQPIRRTDGCYRVDVVAAASSSSRNRPGGLQSGRCPDPRAHRHRGGREPLTDQHHRQQVGPLYQPAGRQRRHDGAVLRRSSSQRTELLRLVCRSTLGVKENVCPVNGGNTPNLGSELLTAGYTFVGFAESLPAVGSPACSAGKYARKHVPWASFTNIPGSHSLPFSAFPAPSNYASLPTVALVIPNLDDDMHDGSIAQGDAWLYQNLSQYASWAKANNSLLILTWDEDDNTARNQIPTVFYGAKSGPARTASRSATTTCYPPSRRLRAAQARLRNQSARHHRHLGRLARRVAATT